MRKWISMICCGLILTLLAGCGSSSGASNSKANNGGGDNPAALISQEEAASEVATEALPVEETTTEPAAETGAQETEPAGETAAKGDGSVDLDLTALSSTMVYSEVYNMMSQPENYIGKNVKMNGIMASYHDEATGKDYYACIIQDATACCSQGMEFVLADGAEYPKDGEEVTVTGVFDTYTEGENRYCTLRNAILG